MVTLLNVEIYCTTRLYHLGFSKESKGTRDLNLLVFQLKLACENPKVLLKISAYKDVVTVYSYYTAIIIAVEQSIAILSLSPDL